MATRDEIRAQRAKLISDASAIQARRNISPADKSKFDSIMARADTLGRQLTQMDEIAALDAGNAQPIPPRAFTVGGAGMKTERERADEETFNAWLRGGVSALAPAQRDVFDRNFQAAQSTGSDAAGGYTVPAGFFRQIEQAQKAYGGMIEAGFVFDTATGNMLPIPTDNDTTSAGELLGENTQTTSRDVQFGAVNMTAFTYTSKMVVVSNQLLQDSAFNLDAFLAETLGTRIARAVNAHFTTGNGASQPTGIITAGTLGRTAGGSTSSGSTDTFDYTDLIELEHSVDPAYRRNARWMMSDAALKVIKTLRDGIGRPLWMAGLVDGAPDTVLGYPYTINQDMAAPAASAKTVAFGDMSKYFIRRVAGVKVRRLTERYADYNQTAFLAFQRWDGNLIDAGTHPVKYLQQSAT